MNKKNIIIIITLFFLCASSVVFAQNINKGLEYYRSGDYHRAEAYFRKVLAKKPYNENAKYMLAASLVHTRKYNEAKELYKYLATHSTNKKLVSLSKTGLSNLGESYNRGVNSAARAILNVSTAGAVMIIRNVHLNDKVNTNFVFDTGASYTTISKTTASTLGITTKGAKTLKIMTGSGYINAPLVKLKKIEVNGLVVRNVDVIVTDLPHHSKPGGNQLTGLLGLSFLKHFKYTVDKEHEQITLIKN